jgi:hypothetical protein
MLSQYTMPQKPNYNKKLCFNQQKCIFELYKNVKTSSSVLPTFFIAALCNIVLCYIKIIIFLQFYLFAKQIVTYTKDMDLIKSFS